MTKSAILSRNAKTIVQTRKKLEPEKAKKQHSNFIQKIQENKRPLQLKAAHCTIHITHLTAPAHSIPCQAAASSIDFAGSNRQRIQLSQQVLNTTHCKL